jgi:protein kinase C substrate 80K-H
LKFDEAKSEEPAEPEQPLEQDQQAEEELDVGGADESTDNQDDIEDQQVVEHHRNPSIPAANVDLTKTKYTSETQALLDESEQASSSFRTAEKELNSINTDIESVKRKLGIDAGSNEEYASLIDECFEFEDREYIYKLCPFERTVQKSKSGQGETSIGTYTSWDDQNPSNKYKIMKFTNGLQCWNGPARSCLVHLLCGVENKVISVSEPNRCEYEMKFETPTACDESFLSQNSRHDHSEL